MALKTTEEEVLDCFDDLKLRPARLVPIKTLWLRWLETAPGGHNTEFADALKQLVRRGIVDAPDGDRSAAVSLTDAGYAAIRNRESTTTDKAASGSVTIFNIRNIGSATGLGVFGDHAAIGAPSPPGGGFDAIARRPFNPEQPSDKPVLKNPPIKLLSSHS